MNTAYIMRLSIYLPEQEEFEQYQPGSKLKSVDLCAFWRRYETEYPSLLARIYMALKLIFSPYVPAMSASEYLALPRFCSQTGGLA